MKRRPVARGQPLAVLALFAAGWIGARVMIVNLTVDPVSGPYLMASPERGAKPAPAARPRLLPDHPRQQRDEVRDWVLATGPVAAFEPVAPIPAKVPVAPSWPVAMRPVRSLLPVPPGPAVAGIAASDRSQTAPVRMAAGHQLLWMAALAHLPLPQELARYAPRQAAVRPAAPALHPSRWSGDAWLLVRRGGVGALSGGFVPPSYGASQAGAVVRYRLDPQAALRPALYLRATTALSNPHGAEVAAGLSLRPVNRIPATLLVETRVTQRPGGASVRPAAMVVSELPALHLPGALRVEAYGQAGYVGGPGATVFADGQARADRVVAHLRSGEVRLGLGVWGGVQRGAGRLDAGPSATLGLPLGGPASSRLALDWRFRLAGQAAPASGPALTLSAGF